MIDDILIALAVLIGLNALVWWGRRYAAPPMRHRNPLFERTYDDGMRVSDLRTLAVELDEDVLRDPVVCTRKARGRTAPVTSVRGTRGGDVIFVCEEWPA